MVDLDPSRRESEGGASHVPVADVREVTLGDTDLRRILMALPAGWPPALRVSPGLIAKDGFAILPCVTRGISTPQLRTADMDSDAETIVCRNPPDVRTSDTSGAS